MVLQVPPIMMSSINFKRFYIYDVCEYYLTDLSLRTCSVRQGTSLKLTVAVLNLVIFLDNE